MLLTISVVVVAAMMVITCIVIIVALFYVIRAVKSVERLAETARPHIAPISHDITVITQKAAGIFDSVQRQTVMIEESVESFRDISTGVRRFQENFMEKVSFPVVKISRFFTAIKVGFETFFNKFLHKESLPE